MTLIRKTSADIAPVSQERAAELRALAERPDSEIDLSDAPELDAEGWKNALQGDVKRSELIKHFNLQRSWDRGR